MFNIRFKMPWTKAKEKRMKKEAEDQHLAALARSAELNRLLAENKARNAAKQSPIAATTAC